MILNYIFNSFQPCKVSDITICTYKSTGSTGTDASLNSDYDLALSGSYKISDIIRCFNQIFEKLFGGQSSTVFDTNLYGYSYLLPYQSVKAYGNIWTRAIPTDSNSIYVLHDDDGIYKNYDQDKWSYLFLYSFYDKYKDRDILPFTMTLPPHLEEMYKDIFKSLQNDNRWSNQIIGDINLSGVMSITETAVYVSCLVRTQPDPYDLFGKEFRKRLHIQMHARKIPSPKFTSIVMKG